MMAELGLLMVITAATAVEVTRRTTRRREAKRQHMRDRLAEVSAAAEQVRR